MSHRRPAPGCRAIRAFALIALGASSTQAQRVLGRVVEERSRHAVPAVEIIAVEIDRGYVSDTVRSDSAGYFQLGLEGSGRYIIRARRLGYEPAITTAFSVGAEQAVELRVFMDAAPTGLARVMVVARRRIEVSTLLDGFEQRRKMGLGTFFTIDDIRRRRPATVTDLLQHVPGLRISRVGGGERISSTRGNLGVIGPGRCMPIFWVDGVRINVSTSESHVLGWLPRGGELQAVEVYAGRASYPAEFAGPEARCGVVAVWTRPPHRGDSATTRAIRADSSAGEPFGR